MAESYVSRLTSHVSPPNGLALVLLVQPGLERREVFQNGVSVHPAFAGHLEQDLLPGLAGPGREHPGQTSARFLAPEEGAAVERPGLPRALAERPVELKLEHPGQEIPHIGDVARHVILGRGHEVLLAAW